MGKIHLPKPVKLFVGMLSPEPALFGTCTGLLNAEYGPVDLQSEISPWTFTDYYAEEMGSVLLRKFVFFEQLMDPAHLADVKIFTTRIEEKMSDKTGVSLKRRINLDPGYITEAKVVLASTKDFSHRIYIGKGIYAEVTLQYKARSHTFTALEHTYPDFRSQESLSMFNVGREMLRKAPLPRQVR